MTENEFLKLIEEDLVQSFLQKFGGRFFISKYGYIYSDGECSYILPEHFEEVIENSIKSWKNHLIELEKCHPLNSEPLYDDPKHCEEYYSNDDK